MMTDRGCGTRFRQFLEHLVTAYPTDQARVLDELTQRMSRDERVTMAVLPLGSGMAVAAKNG